MLVMDSALNIFSLSLAFALVGLNVYLSTKVLNVTDLTCDASVAVGGCLYGALVLYGMNPLVALLLATCFGAVAGFVTSSLTLNINVEPVLASIITLTAFQTFTAKLSSAKPVKGLSSSLFTLSAADNAIISIIIVTIICIIFYKILNSEYGLTMKVFGCGRIISESLGISSSRMLYVGLGIGNALSALAGALITQISGTFSANMGNGSLVFGLAAVIIGEKIVEPKTTRRAIIGCFIGALIYKVMVEVATFGGTQTLGSEYNNVIIALVLIFLMALIQDSKKTHSLKNT
ncbi:MAG: hypothetical protein LBS23_03355 [Holosporaceae bacterium]|nr:hypothetical protein [Holosporaceae bacterium]